MNLQKEQGMHAKTAEMIRSLAEMDGTITAAQLEAGLGALSGITPKETERRMAESLDRLLSVAEVASVLSVSTKTVMRYCKCGLLRRVVRRGGVRATGIAESSVRAFVAGEEAA